MEAVKLPRALEQVESSLRTPVHRLLSVRPEERGTVQLPQAGAEEGTRPEEESQELAEKALPRSPRPRRSPYPLRGMVETDGIA